MLRSFIVFLFFISNLGALFAQEEVIQKAEDFKTNHELDSAIFYYQQALNEALTATSPEGEQIALLYMSLAELHRETGSYVKAYAYSNSAEPYQDSTSYSAERGLYLLKKGKALQEKGDLEAAQKELDNAKAILTLFQDRQAELAEVVNLEGEILYSKELYEEALSRFEEGIDILMANSEENNPLIATLYLNSGKVHTAVNNQVLALKTYGKAIQSAKGFYGGEAHRGVVDLRVEVAQNCSHGVSALKCLDHAMDAAKNIGVAGDLYELDIFMSRGIIQFEDADIPEAKASFEKALEIIHRLTDEAHPDRSRAFNYFSKIHLKKGNYKRAIRYAEKAFKECLVNPKIEKVSWGNVLFPRQAAEALEQKGKVYTALFAVSDDTEDLKPSIAIYEMGLELVDLLRRTYKSHQEKLQLSDLTNRLCHQLVKANVLIYQETGDMDNLNLAFKYTEAAKANVLLEALRDLRAKQVAGIPPALLEKEKTLKMDVSMYKEALFYAMDNMEEQEEAPKKMIKSELTRSEEEYEALLSMFEKDYPKYYELKYKSNSINIPELQRLLKPDELFIEYIRIDTCLYIFTLEKNEIDVIPILLRKDLRDYMVPFMVGLKTINYELFIKHSKELYELLVQPIADRISGNKKLIVIPDADLNYISFELLLKKLPDEENGDYRKLDFLLQNHVLCYNYSASLYAESIQTEKKSNKPFLGFAPEFDNKAFSAIRSKLNPRDDTSSVFVELPGAIAEVEVIGELWEGSTFTGKAATESQFKSAVKDYSIVHLATHTVINNDNPMYSKLILLGDEGEDGLLHTYELFNMNLNAELVTLSACNSGIGKLQEGEGVMSIARGFSYAGCPNIVMSLWPVPDITTAQLMEGFYKHLKTGIPKNEALNRAKQDYLSTADRITASPYYWGGFVVVGNTNPMFAKSNFASSIVNKSEKGIGWKISAGVLALFLVLLVLFKQ